MSKTISQIAKQISAREDELDQKFPNRHKEIHKGCCKHCPANNNRKAGVKDPETQDYKKLPKPVLANKYLFVCAWRPTKLCKGICDEYEIDQNFINKTTP